MRYYGRNRARMLDEEVEEQREPDPGRDPRGYRTCRNCGALRPVWMFEGGNSTCENCLESARQWRARKAEERSER